MRLCYNLYGSWVFVKQTMKEEEEEVILQITRVLICTKLMKDLEIDQFQFAKASNKIRVVFLYALQWCKFC